MAVGVALLAPVSSAQPVLVKDIYPGSSSSSPSLLANFNGTLLFAADSTLDGDAELWKSNGTADGTTMVKNVDPSVHAGMTHGPLVDSGGFTNANGRVYFDASDGSHGYELWKSDGTATGTTMVKNINPSSGGSFPRSLTNVNETLFFVADDTPSTGEATYGIELWKSDGTADGTTVVKDIYPGGAGSVPRGLTNVNGTLYFMAYDPSKGGELWKSDGTADGTTIVKDINPGSDGSFPRSLTNVNGTLYFMAYDPSKGGELWKSDGTAAGTTMVKDINPGSASSMPQGPTYISGEPYLPQDLTYVNETLYFPANDGSHGEELWKSDGTAQGTTIVKNINPGSANSLPQGLTNAAGALFFVANDGSDGDELWKSDGTAHGTTIVKNINPGRGDSFPRGLTNVNGTLYFAANDYDHGYELWKSDGTVYGTTMVSDINPGGANSWPTSLTDIDGTLFFAADDPSNGYELWKFVPDTSPPTDGDGDGIPDASDSCPITSDLAAPRNPRNGCPIRPAGGTAGNDKLTGNNLANVICGLLGNDTLNGLGGDDTLWGDACNDKTKAALGPAARKDGNDVLGGGAGNDKLYGAGGNDTLTGGKGNDRLFGGGGNDKLNGGPGTNSYSGGSGNDSINARNGRKETVDCGRGKTDSARVDKRDKTKGCEKVKRAKK